MPIAQGQVMGRMEVWFRSMCVAECDLVALHRLEDAQEVIRPVDPEQMKVSKFPWKTIGLVIAIVSVSLLLLAVLALLAVRLLGSMRSKTRHKNRRKNHQRSRK
jgi:hypothetical protein